jgi:hypothetical protein
MVITTQINFHGNDKATRYETRSPLCQLAHIKAHVLDD